jgi:outer membrane protein assembly factor BamB
MKKSYLILFLLVLFVGACSKPDPILPGVRTPVFGATEPVLLGNIPADIVASSFGRIKVTEQQKSYEQNLNNEVYEVSVDGTKRKIFAGFPTESKIDAVRTPLFYKNFVYAGLTTGELVKINPKTKNIEWIADIYKDMDMLSGGSVLDIVAPLVIDEDRLFAGGMGRAFCQINISNGDKKWCVDISVASPFLIAGDISFVVGTDSHLYALNTKTGGIYWTTDVKKSVQPRMELDDGKYFVIVGKQWFEATSGAEDD